MRSAAVRKRAERNASLASGALMRPSFSSSSSVRMNMAHLPSHGRSTLGDWQRAHNSDASGETGTHGLGDDPAVLPEATGAPEAGLAGRAARSGPSLGWIGQYLPCHTVNASRCLRRCLGRIGKAVRDRHVPNAVMGTIRTYATGFGWEGVRMG